MTRAAIAPLLAVLTLAVPRIALAVEYEVFIDIEDEEDLYDLQITGQISDQTFNELIDILRRGTDLNTASREELYALPNLTYEEVDRILAYREEAGSLRDPAALVAAEVLPLAKLEAIAPFLIAPAASTRPASVRGFVRYQTIWTLEDRRAPPMALQARVSTARYLTLGTALTLDRNRVGPVTWDPNREALVTRGQRVQVRPAKFFAQWSTPKWGVIAGTYAIGFGQRLVFDTSGRYTPNGFYLDDTIVRQTELTRACRDSTGELTQTPCPRNAPNRYVSPDYRFREGLRGVAAGAKRLELPRGWLQAYGFFSHQTRSIYQYRVVDKAVCDDPRRDPERYPECASPDVYRRGDDLLAPASSLAYTTLPNMFNEILGGGNFSYFLDDRTHFGVTGYGATTQWLVKGAQLDFQDTERFPFGGPWGAIGSDLSFGRAWADVFLEVAHSFDSMGSGDTAGASGRGGGPAVLLRQTASWDTHEVELSGRYYDRDYANPYARPIAAGDLYDGLRARDEAGGRLRYTGTLFNRWSLRAIADFWTQVEQPRPQARLYLRSDVQATRWLTPGAWVEWQDRDLESRERGRCYDVGEESEEGGVVYLPPTQLEQDNARCTGERIRLAGRTRFDPHRRVNFTLQYQHEFVDDTTYTTGMRQDIGAVFMLSANPIDPLRLRARVRYRFDDIANNERLEQSVWSYLDVGYRVRPWFIPSLRYDIRVFVDDRDTTAFRRPNPEHWLHVELMSRF